MAIERLLGDMPAAVFIDDYYLRVPLAMPDRARHLIPLGTWETVESIFAESDLDLLIAREGKLRGGPRPSYAEARALHADGYTVLIRHAERHHPGLAQLASSFRDDFEAPINIHLYCTPPHAHGFGWHYDAEEVFILQTVGSKHYALRKNTVHPLPIVETIPSDMAFEREVTPTFECTLVAADWLYIPAGTWHVAKSGEESISLAVGILSPTALDAFDHLRPELLSSPLWRQRLPPTGQASKVTDEELRLRYRNVIADLGQDLAGRMSEERFVRSFLARTRKEGRPDECG